MDTELENLVFKNYERLNYNDKCIWKYIVSNKNKCKSMSIYDLASKCNVSHTTILRFAKKIGLNGYSELKLYLKMERNCENMFNRMQLDNMMDDINKTVGKLINRNFSYLFKLLDDCSKIYAYGTGKVQLNAVKELKRVLFSVGKLVNVIEGVEELKIATGYMTSRDIIFLVSLSGENDCLNNFAKKFKDNNIKTVCITIDGNNTLSKLCDFSIQFYTHDLVKLENKVSILPLSQFFIINELLLIKYLEYKYCN